jgi:hypothetical protein
MSGTEINEIHQGILERAYKANPHYLNALVEAAKILPQRAEKYSGEANPYRNFELMNMMLSEYFEHKYGHQVDMRDTFIFYIALKFARLLVSGNKDFSDDKSQDSIRDLLNYAALDLGDILKGEPDEV